MSASRSWTPQEVNLLKTLRPTHSNKEIADEFQRRADMGSSRIFARSADSIQKKCQRDGITAATTVDFDPTSEVKSRVQQLKDIQAKYQQPQVRIKRGILDRNKIARKIVSISDIHVPFADSDMLEEVVREHAGPGVWLVINGDLLECYAYSFFTKHSSVSGLHEYQAAFALVAWLRTKFDKVFITSGNHDKRVSRQLKDIGWGSDMSKVLRPDLLARIANGEELDDTGTLIAKHSWDNVYYEQVESWYIRIGKTVFFHPSTKPSSRPGETVQKWAKKFLERYDPYEVDSFVCGHTHKVYEGVVNGYKMMEQGTLAGLMAYAFNPRVLYDGNGQNGYAVIYQDADGNTSFNDSHVFYLGEVVPPKKSVIA